MDGALGKEKGNPNPVYSQPKHCLHQGSEFKLMWTGSFRKLLAKELTSASFPLLIALHGYLSKIEQDKY